MVSGQAFVLTLPMEPLKPHGAERGQKITLIGIGVSLALLLIKGTAGYMGHSYALIADAIESGTDVITSAFVWFGLRVAARRPDQNHPYGHGKAEPLAAVLIGVESIHHTSNSSINPLP
jgi:cation diffusion facilitator family transporter